MAWDPRDDTYKVFAKTPDEELLLWEDWIKIRNEEVTKLGMNLGRPPVDLLLHRLEWKREEKERKRALEEAQLFMKPVVEDRLWAKATRLKQKCPCEPVYEIYQTACDRHRPNIIEHIGTSNYVKEQEMGLIGEPKRKPCPKLNAEYLKYREDRETTLQKQIAKIYPYRPDVTELVVVGHRPKTPPPKIPPLPRIEISEPVDPCYDVLNDVYALRVNETVIYKKIPNQSVPTLQKMTEEPWHESCSSWTYYFNVQEKKIGRSKLLLQNLGTVTLRYCWKKLRKNIPFIPEEFFEQKFFFYKSEDVISPGQSKEIDFTFVSDKPGIYTESWELSLMNTCLFESTADKIVIHLSGDAVENMKKMTKKVEKLQNRIEAKAIYKYIEKLVQDAFMAATSTEPQLCPYKHFLLEAEIFVLKNPVCYYHQTEVQSMKELYKEMTGNDWDLTIKSWRAALIEKGYDERMMYFDCLKKSHRVLLQPWGEEEDVGEQKRRAVRLLLGQLFDKFSFEHRRVVQWNGAGGEQSGGDHAMISIICPLKKFALTPDIISNIFYMRMYDHVANFMETIAGMLSSIEMNRWIQFDFCQY